MSENTDSCYVKEYTEEEMKSMLVNIEYIIDYQVQLIGEVFPAEIKND